MKQLSTLFFAVLMGSASAQETMPTPADVHDAAVYMEQAADRRTERLYIGLGLGFIGTCAVLSDNPDVQTIGAGFYAAAGATMITFEFIIAGKERKAARTLLHKPF